MSEPGKPAVHAPLPRDLGNGTRERPHLCVEVWLAVPVATGHELLMLRRAPGHGGFWQGVSGCLERGDASYAAAAEREIMEETGLDTRGAALRELAGAMAFQGVVSKAWFHKRVLGIVFPRAIEADDVVLSEEHDLVRRVPFGEARRLMEFPENVSALFEFERWLQDVRGFSQ